MKQLKKTLLTLVALIAVTTGAWADGTCGDGVTWSLSGTTLTIGYSGTGTGEMTDFESFDDDDATATVPWKNYVSTITSVVVEDGVINVGEYAFYKFTALTSVTLPASLKYIGQRAFQGCTSLTEFTYPAGVSNIKSRVVAGCTNLTEVTILSTDVEYIYVWAFDGCSSLKTINIYDETPCDKGDNAFAGIANLEHIYVPAGSVDAYKNATIWSDVASYIAAMPAQASSGTPVDITWDAATKTATFTQPAGNVMVTASYYDVAEFADNGEPKAETGVLANTDAPLVSAGVVKNIGNSTTPMGTVMYCVKQQTGNTAPTAPDYDDEGWTDEVPTADGLDEGKAYVWYYIKGAEPANINDRSDENTCNDTPIFALGSTGYVEVGPEPSYKVEFAEGTNEDPNKWTVDPEAAYGENAAGVKKGTKVTLTYDGPRKVIGVKAEKKKAAGPVTYTELKGGEVLHVGDKFILSQTDGNWYIDNCNWMDPGTYELIRANLGSYWYSEPTPAADGTHYILKSDSGSYCLTYFNQEASADTRCPVTATSDGILVTNNGLFNGFKAYTFTTHEKQ